jgi:beta-phosphoglucomutase family hydrolase
MNIGYMEQSMVKLQDVCDYIDSNIECLIFDLDGTIADTMPLHIEAWKEMGLFYGAAITDEMINRFAGSPTNKVIKILNELNEWQMDAEKGAEMKSRLFSEKLDEKESIGVIESMWKIAQLYKNKLHVCIGTGSDRANATKTISKIGAEGFFDIVVTASDVINHKPHPDTFLLSANKLKVEPSKCLVFEDGKMGIDAALAGGMNALFIPDYEFYFPN